MAERKSLKFRNEYIWPILSGQKYLTVRYDDEKEISPGDPLTLTDTGGTPFARTSVIATGQTTVEMFVEWAPDGHRKYAGAHELRRELNRYYDREITADTVVKIIFFHVTERMK